MSAEPVLPVSAARPGRPSRSHAAELTRRILDAATARFLADGYRATSLEAVAKAVCISKRTLYHRFNGKPALFEAVIRRLIDGWRVPFDRAMSPGPDAHDAALEQRLVGIARITLGAALSPEAIALHRLMVSEAASFPELARIVNAQGHALGVRVIAGLLAVEAAAGRLAIAEPELAAEQFLHLVAGAPQRRALGLDAPLDARALDRWVHASVTLFLKGLAP